jgi:hypothetical protein
MGGQRTPLRSNRGRTVIQDAVVKIAETAAQEVEKVQMGGGAAATVGGFWKARPGYPLNSQPEDS